jgi:hypothetical protein
MMSIGHNFSSRVQQMPPIQAAAGGPATEKGAKVDQHHPGGPARERGMKVDRHHPGGHHRDRDGEKPPVQVTEADVNETKRHLEEAVAHVRAIIGNELLTKSDIKAAVDKVVLEGQNWSLKDEKQLHSFPSEKKKLLETRLRKPHAHLKNICKKTALAGCNLCVAWMALLDALGKDNPEVKARVTDEIAGALARRAVVPLAIGALGVAAIAYAAGAGKKSPRNFANVAQKLYDVSRSVAGAESSASASLGSADLGHTAPAPPPEEPGSGSLFEGNGGSSEPPSPASSSSFGSLGNLRSWISHEKADRVRGSVPNTE